MAWSSTFPTATGRYMFRWVGLGAPDDVQIETLVVYTATLKQITYRGTILTDADIADIATNQLWTAQYDGPLDTI